MQNIVNRYIRTYEVSVVCHEAIVDDTARRGPAYGQSFSILCCTAFLKLSAAIELGRRLAQETYWSEPLYVLRSFLPAYATPFMIRSANNSDKA